MIIDLVIDTREHAIINYLRESSIKFVTEQLDIGDILLRSDTGEVFITIERKTINDLIASMSDGRRKEQTVRLVGVQGNGHVIYLIEGKINGKLSSEISGTSIKKISSALINNMFRDKFMVYKTHDTSETCEFLINLRNKLETDDIDLYRKSSDSVKIDQSEYHTVIKKKKKDNMTPETWFTVSLAQIPSISDVKAKAISTEYKSLEMLMLSYESCSSVTEKELMLSEIKVKDKKLGKAVSATVYKCMHGI